MILRVAGIERRGWMATWQLRWPRHHATVAVWTRHITTSSSGPYVCGNEGLYGGDAEGEASDRSYEHIRVPYYWQKRKYLIFILCHLFLVNLILLYLLMTLEHGTQPNGSSN
jgi:hypothetical protein